MRKDYRDILKDVRKFRYRLKGGIMLNKANFEEMMGGNATVERIQTVVKYLKGYHKMPDGSIMKDSDMVKKTNGGSMTNTKKHLRRP